MTLTRLLSFCFLAFFALAACQDAPSPGDADPSARDTSAAVSAASGATSGETPGDAANGGDAADGGDAEEAAADTAMADASAPAASRQNRGTEAAAARVDTTGPGPADVPQRLYTTTESGLKYYDLREGDGPSPEATDRVRVHYAGWLQSNGEKFDSSYDRGQPITFPLNGVIEGWTEGLQSMEVGGKRQLVIPSELGYGQRGTPDGSIPPGATLVFEVELLGIPGSGN